MIILIIIIMHYFLSTEILKVAGAGSYEKEFWAMSEEERLMSIPALKEEGNTLYKAGDHEAACKKYSEALGRLEQLMLRYSVSGRV